MYKRQDYSGIVAHPVFIATRLPEPPPEDAPPVESPPANPAPAPALLGVIIMPQATVALLRPEQPGAKAVRIKVGEMVGEWRLEAVFPNRVVLSKGLTKQELALVRSKPVSYTHLGIRIVWRRRSRSSGIPLNRTGWTQNRKPQVRACAQGRQGLKASKTCSRFRA